MQDITNIPDEAEFKKVLYKILLDLDTRLAQFRQFVLDSNMAIPFILNNDGNIPNGYKQCLGNNGTYNLTSLEQSITNKSKIVYIQKVQ